MTLDHIAVDQRGVTGIESFRHALLALEIGKAFPEEDFRFYFKTLFFQMADPALATASSRRLVNRDLERRGFRLAVGDNRQEYQADVDKRSGKADFP
jgi:hypothetical protein